MDKEKIQMVIAEEYQRILWEHTLQGGLEWNEKDKNSGQKLSFTDFFDVIRPTWKTHQPREIFEVDVNGIHIELFRTKHVPDSSSNWETSFVSFGMMIDQRVFISGDTRFDPELIDLYKERSEVMFHDVQFFPGAVHAPLEDLKTLPDDVKKKMLLMHYSDDYIDQDISDFMGWTRQGTVFRFG